MSDMSPIGKLSGIPSSNRMFQIQTEYYGQSVKRVQTIVILDGKILFNKITEIADNVNEASIKQLVTDQHLEVEMDLKIRLKKREEKHSSSGDTQKIFIGK